MKIAFLFSGQGAQYPGMMQELYENDAAVRDVFSCADLTLKRSISQLCFQGTQQELNLTHNTQPCVLAADLAAGMVLRAHGVQPEGVAGFSLGEYAALAFAGAFSNVDAFEMVQIRADAMQEAVAAGEGAMAAVVGLTAEMVEKLCNSAKSGYVVPANYNSPTQTVVSGTAAGVDEVIKFAEAEGAVCMKLAVSAPFHCALMEPAAKKLDALFRTKVFSKPSFPVYMNYDGVPVSEGDAIPDLLVKQAMNPVRWVQTLNRMRDDGFDTFIECGPGRTLSGLVKKSLKGVAVYRVENLKTLDAALVAVGSK